MNVKAEIKLDQQEIVDAMWNNCNGSHVLAVAPDGNDHRVHWMENNRQWDPWPEDWLTIGIPAIDPDGSGEESQDAKELLEMLGLIEKARTLIESEDIDWTDAIEQLALEDWKANRENAADWLAEAFLAACNGDGGDLNDSAPWGFKGGSYDEPEANESPAEFEWA